MNLQSIKRGLISLYHEMLPPVLFFFIAFLLIGVIFKLLRHAILDSVHRVYQSRRRRADHRQSDSAD